MGTVLGVTAGFGLMLWAVVWLAKASGKKAAQLEALKNAAEKAAQEWENLYAVQNHVHQLAVDDVRRRLQHLPRK